MYAQVTTGGYVVDVANQSALWFVLETAIKQNRKYEVAYYG